MFCGIAFPLPGRDDNVDIPIHQIGDETADEAGVTGGIRLWEPELDELFCGVAMAQPREIARQP